MNWYRNEISRDDTPIEFIDKIDLVHYISNYRVIHKKLEFEKMILGMKSGKLKDLIPLLEAEKKELTEDNIKELMGVILSKKKVCDLIIGKDKLQHLLEDIETGNYIDDVEICERWEHEISRNYTKITEIKRANSINDITFLDLKNDDYSAVENSIRERYNPKNIMKTGYKSVDNLFPANGIEIGRFYIIGGTSGVGKSNLLINFIRNAIVGNSDTDYESDGIFLYLTGENLIDESLERTYCCLSGTKHTDMVNKILTDPTFSLKKDILEALKKYKSNILMRHFRAGVTTSTDIASIVEEVAATGRLKAVYLDYLDLTRSGLKLDDLRLDLNQACLDYKEIAKDYRIPFITCTQLNRSGYDKEQAPSLISMSESMKKVDNADFVLFLQPADTPKMSIPFNGGQKHYDKIKMTVLKNRNGETGSSTHLVMAVRMNNEKIFNYRMEEMPKLAEAPTVDKDYVEKNGWDNNHQKQEENSPWDSL